MPESTQTGALGFSSGFVATTNVSSTQTSTNLEETNKAFSDASTGTQLGTSFSLLDSNVGDVTVVDPGAIIGATAVARDALSAASLGITGAIGTAQEAIKKSFALADKSESSETEKILPMILIAAGILFLISPQGRRVLKGVK